MKLYVIGVCCALEEVVVRGRDVVLRRAAGRFVAVRRALLRAAVERFAAVVVAAPRAVVERFRAAVVERLRAVVVALRRAVVLLRALDDLRAGLLRAVERFAALRFAAVRFAVLRFAVLRLAVVRLAVVRFAVARFAVVRFAAGRRLALVPLRAVALRVLLLAFRAVRRREVLALWVALRAGRLRVFELLRVVGIVLPTPLRAAPRRAVRQKRRVPPGACELGWPPCLASAPRNVADNRGRTANRHCRTAK